jgi:hypothetical protein
VRSMLASMETGFRAAFEGDEAAVRLSLGFFGQTTSGTAWLQTALASTIKRTPLDETLAVMLGRTQLPNGQWRVGAPRLPIEESDMQTRALVIRVLLTFAPTHPETSWRVERSRAWLLSNEATTTHDRVYRLLGLRWAGADHADLQEAMKALVKEQGFPHGFHQFSSFAGTTWATMALMYAAGPRTP